MERRRARRRQQDAEAQEKRAWERASLVLDAFEQARGEEVSNTATVDAPPRSRLLDALKERGANGVRRAVGPMPIIPPPSEDI